jgi:hypothetical protein
MAKPRGPYVPRLLPKRAEEGIRRDLMLQFTAAHLRWLQWSTPDADSIRAAEESHVRSRSRQEHTGDPEVSGEGLRGRWSRKLKFAGKSLEKETQGVG